MKAAEATLQDARLWLLERIHAQGSKPCLHFSAGSKTYADLGAEIRTQKQRLAQSGVMPGEVVALVSDYSFRSIAMFLALYENKNILVPIATKVESEIADRLDLVHTHHVIYQAAADDALEIRRGQERPLHSLLSDLQARQRSGLVLFSSGSTGRPKAMVHDLDRMVDTYLDRKPRTLTIMVFLMFDHIGGLNSLLVALASGSAVVVPESRKPEVVCRLISKHEVSVLPASPTFLNLALMSGVLDAEALPSLRIVTYGTEPMPESLLLRLKGKLPRVRFLQTFGTSETGISQTVSYSSTSTLVRFDDPNTEHKIVNGELWLRSRTQILGYLNYSMENFTSDGWFRTGDLVEAEDGGYLRIRGRISEVINVGGQKVLPAEVESVILELPGVEDCAVFAEPNALTGQVVCTKVKLIPGTDTSGIRSALRLFCRSRLDSYKIPVKVIVSTEPLFGARYKKARRMP